MADLTFTLTIAGTVGSKTYNFQHTHTVTSVVDVVDVDGYGGRSETPFYVANSGSALTTLNGRMDKTTFDHCFVVNRSTAGRAWVKFNQETGPQYISFWLLPGMFFLMHKAAAGGNFNTGTTATTSTFIEVDTVYIAGSQTGGRAIASYK